MQNLNYHNIFLSKIKKELNASFCGYERTKDDYQLKIIVNKNPEFFELNGSPDHVTPQRYIELLENLKQHYEKV